jgi:hypothetical protein
MGPVKALRVGYAVVPVTYASARQAGLDRTQALRVVTVSVSAAALALQRHPGHRHQQNAVRHFVWQAWLSAHFGRTVACAIGDRHERKSSRPLSHQVDVRNNDVGQHFGAFLAEEIRPMPLPEALDVLAGHGDDLWQRGRLWTAAEGHVGHSP